MAADERIILPGSTLGVLGGGQLGRMFAIAARRMGYRVHVLAPGEDTPTGQVADLHVDAAYDDLDAVAAFARQVAVVTFEFENISAAATEAASRHAPVRPAGSILHTTQNRVREKTALRTAGLPVTPFAPVDGRADLERAVKQIGAPAVLKTAAWGYDGKGQTVIRSGDDLAQAWRTIGLAELHPAILERMIDFDRELSIIVARTRAGEIAMYEPFGNAHARHILDVTLFPAPVEASVAEEARQIGRAVAESLDLVGVLCIELFLTRRNELMINELAPRPHNSGHVTIDACITDQFEQQVRAICNLPLGSVERHRPAAMANLLGDLWPVEATEPPWEQLLEHRDVKLHLYGKTQARPGRKMGHLTALADSTRQAEAKVRAAREVLAQRDG